MAVLKLYAQLFTTADYLSPFSKSGVEVVFGTHNVVCPLASNCLVPYVRIMRVAGCRIEVVPERAKSSEESVAVFNRCKDEAMLHSSKLSYYATHTQVGRIRR